MKRKRRFGFQSMRARMTAAFACVIALLMALICGGMTAYLHRIEHRAVDELLDQSAREVSLELRDNPAMASRPAAIIAEEGEEMRDRNLAVLVVDASGRVLAQSQKRIPTWPLRDDDDDWRIRQIPAGASTSIVLAAPWGAAEHGLRNFALALGGVSVLVVLFSSLGAWILVGRTLSPIGLLARHAADASTDDLRVQLRAPSGDVEVTDLVSTLNDLLLRQARAAQAKGRFYASASHELRTPLQALSGLLEVGLSRERSNESLRATLGEAQEQSRQLVELVRDLLLLNQLDMATSAPPAQEVDVPDVAERVLKQLEPQIHERGLQVSTDWASAGEVTVPWNHLEMLCRNILENAVKYASLGGAVRVWMRASTWEVWNECAPVAGWDEDKYFEPFFRPDASRNSATGGNGLGLAICKAICTSNGWHITLAQEPGGVRVQVRFTP